MKVKLRNLTQSTACNPKRRSHNTWQTASKMTILTVFVTALGYVAKSKGIANIAQDTGFPGFVQISFRRQALRWDTIHRVMKSLNIKLQPTA